MAKAVLVMDMPESCDKCRFKLNVPYNRNYCYIRQDSCDKECLKPDWCPLRELPEKMELCGVYNSEYYAKGGKMPSYKAGWNACLDAIMK